ncbi:MAG: penicillin acylase [Solirubrobacterales bacterium]|nr:penicillin acylase [Solirubrobacterales bacterium]
MRRRIVVLSLCLAALAAPAAARADDAPYGANDAGGFRNVLPAGENGLVNALGLGANLATGAMPAHYNDQLPLYTGLVYASPSLTHDQIASYYKDATFGVKPGDVASSESPAAGVTIVRDKGYGVPHVYGVTRANVEFGAGYAGAEDRLFLMDVLRHTGRGQLASFAGGSPSNRAMDETQWAIAPYTEADLQQQIDQAGPQYGAAGRALVADVQAYVDGINAYIARTRLDPTALPAEYVALGTTPQAWKLTDVVATASLIGGIFGKGGGNELNSVLTLQAMEKRFGPGRARKVWSDFREKNDPEAAVTVKQRFPYETASPFSPRGLAAPKEGSVTFTPVTGPAPAAAARVRGFASEVGAQLLKAARSPAHASNWLMVAARHSTTGHPIGVLGPQVGYYVPEILMEEDLHGPGFDARGAAFPGVNLYVQLGHGRDYAWSATTANADNVDTFAEVLCQDDFHYSYKGQCLAMDKLVRVNSWHPTLADSTPAGSETLTAYRTVHGIVYARGIANGKKVAFVSARTTYFHEADSALGFSRLNNPNDVHDPASFRAAIGQVNFGFNWAYIDSQHIAYQLSGWDPVRARRTSPDFPVLGTGAYDWQGFDPATHTMKVLSNDQRPHAIDPDYLVSWNNKQAPGFAAADDQWGYGPTYRQAMLVANVKSALAAGGGKMPLEKLVTAMDEAATQDIRPFSIFPSLFRALGRPSDPALRDAIARLKAWRAAGGHRRDLDKDGKDDADPAIVLMDAWWPKLLQAEFGPVLGPAVYNRVKGMLGTGGGASGGSPDAPDFADGWWQYVSKDLRDLYGPRPARGARWSRIYCGRGSKARCRRALQASLKAALSVTAKDLYAHGACATNPDPACHDMNRWSTAAAISIRPFPFQNRPTFQQTVELSRSVPR